MELLKTLINSWPLVTLILGVVALFLFRKPLIQLLTRAEELGLAGIKVSAKAQEQRNVEDQPKISKTEKLAKSFQSPLLIEVEELIRKDLDVFSKDKEEREKVLITYLAVNQIVVSFERIYFSIFGSQLSSLQFLSSSQNILESPDSLRPFYEQAKSKYTEFYGTYSFNSWLSFLQSQTLITNLSGKVGITVRGKEFLKYLIDQGYSFKKGG